MIDQKEIWFEYCMDYCNTDFGGGGYDTAPAIIKKVVGMLVSAEANKVQGVSSKTAEGMTVESYVKEIIGADVLKMLHNKRKIART